MTRHTGKTNSSLHHWCNRLPGIETYTGWPWTHTAWPASKEVGRESWGKWELDRVIKSRWSSRDGEVRNSISVGGPWESVFYISQMFRFNIAAITDYEKVSSLWWHQLILLRCRGQKGKDTVWTGPHFFWKLPGKTFPCFFQRLEDSCAPWLSAPSLIFKTHSNLCFCHPISSCLWPSCLPLTRTLIIT